MKKLFYLGFALVLAMGVGCALTNYELIVDNDQVKQGFSGPVNTAGKAHVRESSQIATIWPDGTDETLWFVDQKANGDRTLTTYNNYSPTGDPTFHDDLYCNPDWQGCALVTADDPEIGDVDTFDYKLNVNCLGVRSLSYLFSTTRYYGECGRAIQDLGALIMMGEPRNGGLFYLLTPANTSILLTSKSDGTTTAMTLNADIPIFVKGMGDRHMTMDMSNPVQGLMKDKLANHADIHGAANQITLQFNGLSKTLNVKLLADNLHKSAKRF